VPELVAVFIAGFAASLVDGALGMGFGPTSSSILLGTGLSPAGISTTVNLAKVATGLTAAVAHWRFENIDRRIVRRLVLPGSLGALVGVTVLANVDADTLKPILAVLLLAMAARILLRFSRPMATRTAAEDDGGAGRYDARGTAAVAALLLAMAARILLRFSRPMATRTAAEDDGGAGRYDARGTAAVAAAGGVTNGLIGAWGPVVTPFLLQRGLAPRYAIGSVNTAEVAVAVVASGSLLASVGGGGIDIAVVVAMLAGGVLAAPVAAWAIGVLPARALGVAVGGLLFVLNTRELTSSSDLHALRWPGYALAAVACAYAAVRPRRQRTQLPLDA
jgi:uncharacterized membrane protein YfcA